MFRVIYKLVLDLNDNDVPAVLVKQALHFFRDLAVPFAHFGKIRGVVRPQLHVLFKEPVRKTAVTAFSVRPRPDAQSHIKPKLPACFDKVPYIIVARKIINAFGFLVIYPEKIRRHERDAARFDLFQLFLPVLFFKP